MNILNSLYKLLLLSGMCLVLLACEDSGVKPENEVIGVNEFKFSFNDTEAGGIIRFKTSQLKSCMLSFIKSKFTKGYSVEITKAGEGDIDLTCSTDEHHFSMDSSGTAKTYARMEVVELSGTATVKVSFLLFDINSKQTVDKKDIVLNVSKQQLQTMMAN